MLLVRRSYLIHQFHELDRRCIYVRATQVRLPDGEKKTLIVTKAPSMQMQIKDTTGADDRVAVLKQIMASDFIKESTAEYLRHDVKEARLLLETQQARQGV